MIGHPKDMENGSKLGISQVLKLAVFYAPVSEGLRDPQHLGSPPLHLGRAASTDSRLGVTPSSRLPHGHLISTRSVLDIYLE